MAVAVSALHLSYIGMELRDISRGIFSAFTPDLSSFVITRAMIRYPGESGVASPGALWGKVAGPAYDDDIPGSVIRVHGQVARHVRVTARFSKFNRPVAARISLVTSDADKLATVGVSYYMRFPMS